MMTFGYFLLDIELSFFFFAIQDKVGKKVLKEKKNMKKNDKKK